VNSIGYLIKIILAQKVLPVLVISMELKQPVLGKMGIFLAKLCKKLQLFIGVVEDAGMW